ncbi:hypothetical protein KEM48_008063 [Puccinia striiformis f. sp. tritici PST-130]|nr:hypothetical protein H4Q26_008215 [Puccinia striiformis f. sp. tritici PST-130]KAI9620713.1 hypothetical protein KEM48_008063 [Puccinia striiformis f. sp. tritici PST-130]
MQYVLGWLIYRPSKKSKKLADVFHQPHPPQNQPRKTPATQANQANPLEHHQALLDLTFTLDVSIKRNQFRPSLHEGSKTSTGHWQTCDDQFHQ